ncbi:MAG: response regulator [Methylobacterium sp.]|jgi:CheY-like chemotaxis protein|uniref:response regulator n=1 Tax=Methylobacterium sp. TaxID=409 RepID=UPI00271889A2|nr:response regulator [Methylobacterium sp.]MDO9428501.1 response regulator [Methylobacterium sp.]
MASVLVVDDIPVVRMTIRKFLERGGHRVVECGSTAEAIAALTTQAVDLIVTDLWMPGQDGLALIRHAKSRPRPLPLVAVTGGAPRAPQLFSTEEAVRAGADRVLMKPVGMRELLACVTELLAGRLKGVN